MKICICNDWKENSPKLEDVFVWSNVHGLKYTGKFFVYCPWCGEKLVDEIIVAVVEADIKLEPFPTKGI
jgi:hypothetical protein